MLPIDSVSKKPWKSESANAALQHIRKGCIAALRERDAGFGIGPDGKVYFDPTDEEGQPGRYVVNEELARKKHTGGELVSLTKSRWANFCAEPQDESAYMIEYRLNDRSNTRAKANAEAADVEKTLVGHKPKRGPGRPRGGRNKSPEPLTPEPEPVAVTETTEAASAEG